MRPIQTILLCIILTGSVLAESKIFLDEMFPYRVVCKPTWEEVVKNDTHFVVQDLAPGRKTQLQLRRYTIDTGFSFEPMHWSRLNYMVNRELALGVGDIITSDTSAAKKLGDLRAFELFALYSQEVGENTIWWAEYCRWTERNNFGYLVVIMGDTLDLQNNFSLYQSMMDSIHIKELDVTHTGHLANKAIPVIRRSAAVPSSATFDLLGRIRPSGVLPCASLLLRRHTKALWLRETTSP